LSALPAGEDLSQPEADLACLEVFALGGGQETRALGESSYSAARTLLAKSVSEAARVSILGVAAPPFVANRLPECPQPSASSKSARNARSCSNARVTEFSV